MRIIFFASLICGYCHSSHHDLVIANEWSELSKAFYFIDNEDEQWEAFYYVDCYYKCSLIDFINKHVPKEYDFINYNEYFALLKLFSYLKFTRELCGASTDEVDLGKKILKEISKSPIALPEDDLTKSCSSLQEEQMTKSSPREAAEKSLSSKDSSDKLKTRNRSKSSCRSLLRAFHKTGSSSDLEHRPNIKSVSNSELGLVEKTYEERQILDLSNDNKMIRLLENTSKKIMVFNNENQEKITIDLSEKTKLGSGVQGAVFKVVTDHGPIAIKISPPNPQKWVVEDFQNEWRMLKHLGGDPNLCCLKAWDSDGTEYCYLIKDFAAGCSLFSTIYTIDDGKFIRNKANFSRKEITLISLWMLKAMQYVHSKNIIHRDIKPENIILDRETLTVKIIDFGCACEAAKGSRVFFGSKGYKGPERTEGLICAETISSDDWGIAVIIAELISKVGNWRQYVEDRSQFDEVFKKEHLEAVFSDIASSIDLLLGEQSALEYIEHELVKLREGQETEKERLSLQNQKNAKKERLRKSYNVLLLALRDFTFDGLHQRPTFGQKEKIIASLERALENERNMECEKSAKKVTNNKVKKRKQDEGKDLVHKL